MSETVMALCLIELALVNVLTYYLLYRANERLRNRRSRPPVAPAVALALIGGAPAVLLSKQQHRMLPRFPLSGGVLIVLAILYPALIVPPLLHHFGLIRF